MNHSPMAGNLPRPPLTLALMPQLVEVRDIDDDWTGITNAASRRKRQTRLNTRAYRRRKAHELAIKKSGGNTFTPSGDSIPCWNDDIQAVINVPAAVVKAANAPLIPKNRLQARIFFPLSSDHLITLIHVNTLRAIMTNSQLIQALMPNASYDCTNGALHIVPSLTKGMEIPPSLSPTRSQSAVPHGGWIDCFPHPGWRDNFIRALGTFDEYELASDIAGSLFQNRNTVDSENRGLIVWSPPWHHSGWEMSEGFIRKWGWSIRGCEDLLQVTNDWRGLRGEAPLKIEEIID